MPILTKATLDRARAAAGVTLLGGAAVLGAPLLIPEAPVQAAVPPRITVRGEALLEGTDAYAEATRLAALRLDALVTLRAGAVERSLSWRELGGRVDESRLARWITEAADAASPLRRAHERRGRADALNLPLPLSLDAEPATALLVELKSAIDQEPLDARLDVDSGAISAEREGLRVDVWATLEGLDRALLAGDARVEVTIEHTAARRKAEELEGVNMSASLGEFETRYNASFEAEDRTHNLRVAARKIDGLVLMPGETFDFNDVVGERNQANGFVPATVIAGGELVDGLGGGACQIAGTLHAAAFFSGLEIIERHPHSRPSTYIKLGLDAAVSYPNLNFQFRNDTERPVVVRLTVEGGITRASILGAERRDMVSFVRRIDGWQPYPERDTEDPRLPEGVRVLSQRGVPGFTLSRWRIIRDVEQNQARRRSSQDTYPPTTQIWRVGTGEPASEGYEAPRGDTHLEYRADVYTVMTQGPDVEGTQTRRRPGIPGAPGWTEREGMPPAHRE